jgi:hypothetical protein
MGDKVGNIKKSFGDQIAILNEAIKREKKYSSINNAFQLNVKKCKILIKKYI